MRNVLGETVGPKLSVTISDSELGQYLMKLHSDGKLQVGLRACTGSGVLGTAPNLPLASNEETGSLRGRGASHWIVASEPGEAPTPAFPLLCLFECDSIRGRLPEIHENPLYY